MTQQATLETRQAKHEPRSLAEQRATWQAEAATVLGGRHAVTDMVAKALSPWPAARETVDAAWVSQTADRVLAAMEERRSTWQMWHVRAEAQRHIRTTDIPAERSDALVDLLVDDVLHTRSVLLAPPDDGIEEPEGLRRVDGSSTCTQRPPVENSTPQQTWQQSWTGASQSRQPPTQGRFLGFPGFRKRFMIIPFGTNIWRSGPA